MEIIYIVHVKDSLRILIIYTVSLVVNLSFPIHREVHEISFVNYKLG